MSTIDIIRNKSLVEYIQGVYPNDSLEYMSDGTWRSTCPLHRGATNATSFAVFPNNKYFCFSCNRHGDLISFVMEREGLLFFQAVEHLAEKYSIDLDHDESYVKQKSIAKSNEIRCRQYEANLDKVYDYLIKDRGLTDEIIKAHRCGYNDGVLTIAMFDLYGRLVGFGFRYFDQLPKYKNSKNNELFQKGSYLFNINNAAKMVHKNKRLYIVEGHIDAMSIQQQGEAAVAYCGITFSKEHVILIKQITEHIDGVIIILVPDNDDRANKYIDRGRLLFAKYYSDANVKIAKIGEV